MFLFFFFQAEDGIRDVAVTGVQTCALPIYSGLASLWQLARLVPAGNFRPRRKCLWRTRRNVCRAGGRLEHIAVHECSVYVVLPYRRVRDVLHWLARQPRVEQGESAMKCAGPFCALCVSALLFALLPEPQMPS